MGGVFREVGRCHRPGYQVRRRTDRIATSTRQHLRNGGSRGSIGVEAVLYRSAEGASECKSGTSDIAKKCYQESLTHPKEGRGAVSNSIRPREWLSHGDENL